MPEARLADSGSGLAPVTDGWFVVNVRDAEWWTAWCGADCAFENELQKVEFPRPVFHGDTIYAETEVVEKRESRSRPQWGIVVFEHRATNQAGEVVMRCRRAAMMRRKGA